MGVDPLPPDLRITSSEEAGDESAVVDALHALASFDSAFDETTFTVGKWAGGKRGRDGTTSMPWFSFSAPATKFIRQAYALGLIRTDFDWPRWSRTRRAARLLRAGGNAVSTASADELTRLLTVLVRGDRFNEGLLAAAFASGLVREILRRAAAV